MRIAHLSDLHLRHHLPGEPPNPERQSRRMPELLEQAMSLVRTQTPDLLVVTGDLVDYPQDELENPERLRQGDADLALTAELLAQCGCPHVAIPGNHDHTDLFAQHFSPSVDQIVAGYRVLCFPEDHEEEAHVPHRRGRSLRRFRSALESAGSPPQVHVQHYLVWPEMNESYPHTYAEAPSLLDEIVASGAARLCLSGHLHAGIEPFQVGETTFSVVPAFCVAPHPIWVYDLGAQGVTWRTLNLALAC